MTGEVTLPVTFEAVVEEEATPRRLAARWAALPSSAVDALEVTGTCTVNGSLNGIPFVRKSVKRRSDGRFGVDLVAAGCKKAGVATGDVVEVTVARVCEEAPGDLLDAIAGDRVAQLVWDRLTAAQRRQAVNDVERAKSLETRQRRIEGYVRDFSNAPKTHARFTDLA